MAEHYGFYIEERDEGQFEELVENVDPKYHRAIAWGLSALCDWYGDKAYRKLDDWFTVVYGVILMVEEMHKKELKPGVTKLNYEDLVTKDPNQTELF